MQEKNNRENWQRWLWFSLSLGSFLAGVCLSGFVLWQDRLLGRTLSNVGNHNQEWFLIWSICFSLACMINLMSLGIKLRLGFKIRLLLGMMLLLVLPLAVLQALIIDYSVQPAHIILATTFAAYGLICIVLFNVLLIIEKTRQRKRFYWQGFLYFILLAVVGMSNIFAHEYYGFLIAAYQLALVYACLITVFLMQLFTRKIRPQLQEKFTQFIQ